MILFRKKRSKRYCKGLNNEDISVECGDNTFVDPEIIVDSPESVTIGSNTIIRKGVVLRPETGKIVIGDNCVINHYCIFHGKGGIYIGDWSIIGPHSGFYAQNHTYERFEVPITMQQNIGKGIFLMGDNWIGGHSVICDDVTLGKGTVIGANSTVLTSFPMATIAAGNPAKIIRKRHSGAWEFGKVERASLDSMPTDILEYVQKRGIALLKHLNHDDVVLEVGCGEGIITSILRRATLNIVGCDYSLEGLGVARRNNPEIDFVHSTCTNLRFESNRFTKVVLSDVAEHLLPMQFTKTLSEINRVLKTNGELVLSTPLTGKGKLTSAYAHIYEYSEMEMKTLLEKFFRKVLYRNDGYAIFRAMK